MENKNFSKLWKSHSLFVHLLVLSLCSNYFLRTGAQDLFEGSQASWEPVQSSVALEYLPSRNLPDSSYSPRPVLPSQFPDSIPTSTSGFPPPPSPGSTQSHQRQLPESSFPPEPPSPPEVPPTSSASTPTFPPPPEPPSLTSSSEESQQRVLPQSVDPPSDLSIPRHPHSSSNYETPLVTSGVASSNNKSPSLFGGKGDLLKPGFHTQNVLEQEEASKKPDNIKVEGKGEDANDILSESSEGLASHSPSALRQAQSDVENEVGGVFTANAYGSIHETAYYFADALIGSPVPQRESLILDTGSSVIGFKCKDCKKCGTHLDDPLDPEKSETIKKVPCTPTCTYCDRASTRCGYKVSYLEGSSLKGLWYDDFVSFVKPISETILRSIAALSPQPTGFTTPAESNPNYSIRDIVPTEQNFRMLSTKIKVRAPFGCHMEETHLFTSQDASGILGLELWSQYGPNTFISTALATDQFRKKIFSLCLAEHGGVFTVGAMNTQYHVDANTPDADIENENNEGNTAAALPSYMAWSSYYSVEQSYRVRLIGMKVGDIDIDLFSEAAALGQLKAINTLVDSGTTLSYFAPHTYSQMWAAIQEMLKRKGKNVFGNSSVPRHVLEMKAAKKKEKQEKSDIAEYEPTIGRVRRLLAEDETAPEQNKQEATEGKNDDSKSTNFSLYENSVPPLNLQQNTTTVPLSLRKAVDGAGALSGTPPAAAASSSPATSFLSALSSLFSASSARTIREEKQSAAPSSSSNSNNEESETIERSASIEKQQEIVEEDEFDLYDKLPRSAKPRRAQGKRVEECFYLPNGDSDLSAFPVITLKFSAPKNNRGGRGDGGLPYKIDEENNKVDWYPQAYMYKKSNPKYRCLAITPDASSVKNAVLGSSFFIGHDVVFDVENSVAGFAVANCPSAFMRYRFSKWI